MRNKELLLKRIIKLEKELDSLLEAKVSKEKREPGYDRNINKQRVILQRSFKELRTASASMSKFANSTIGRKAGVKFPNFNQNVNIQKNIKLAEKALNVLRSKNPEEINKFANDANVKAQIQKSLSEYRAYVDRLASYNNQLYSNVNKLVNDKKVDKKDVKKVQKEIISISSKTEKSRDSLLKKVEKWIKSFIKKVLAGIKGIPNVTVKVFQSIILFVAAIFIVNIASAIHLLGVYSKILYVIIKERRNTRDKLVEKYLKMMRSITSKLGFAKPVVEAIVSFIVTVLTALVAAVEALLEILPMIGKLFLNIIFSIFFSTVTLIVAFLGYVGLIKDPFTISDFISGTYIKLSKSIMGARGFKDVEKSAKEEYYDFFWE